jgi:hypothetical protein
VRKELALILTLGGKCMRKLAREESNLGLHLWKLELNHQKVVRNPKPES